MSKTYAPFVSHVDANQNPSITGVVGTLGTADTAGTAKPLPIGVDPTTGAAYVYNLGPAGSVSLGNTPGGTINEIGTVLGVGGVVQVSGTVATGGAGTQPVRIIDGTVTSLGTAVGMGTVTNVGSVTNIGTLKEAGLVTGVTTGSLANIAFIHSIGTMPAISIGESTGGTLDVLTSVTEVANLAKGTVTKVEGGTITIGSIANGARILVSGDIAGTAVLVAPGGGAVFDVINTAGTQQTLGTVGVVNNLVKGTVTRLEGGTVQTNIETGTVTALTNGTVRISVGTIVGPTASGGTPTTAPVLVAGTDATGTVYAPLVTSAGALTVTGASAGTVVQVETGTLGLVSNLTSGSVRMTVGTVTTGSLTNLATLHNGTVVISAVTPAISVAPAAAGDFGERQEASTFSGGQKGLFVLAVRNDNGTSISNGDLDYSAFQVDANGALRISGTVATGAGTQPVELIKGTVTNVGTLVGIGTITNIGSISNIGTMPAVSLALNTGTITTIAAGTQNTLGTIGTVNGLGGTSNVVDLDDRANNQFKLIKSNVLATPNTISGNHTMAWDGANMTYYLVPGSPNSNIYSYNMFTDTLGTVATGTFVDQLYPGAALTYANGSLYFPRGGGFASFHRIGTGGGAVSNLTNSPSTVNFGADMWYDGSDYVYLVSAAPGFQRYSIGSNSWGSLAVVPFTGAEGLSLAPIGTDRLASLQGAGATGFAIYNITTGTWASKAVYPATTYDGAALGWNGGNYIYSYRGIGARDAYKYEITEDKWYRLPNIPLPASTGATLLPKKDGNFLTYIAEPSGITDFGIVNNLYTYDPSRLNIVNTGIPIGGVNRTGELNNGNPVVLAGTNTGGTVVGLRIDSAGIPEVYAVGGGGVKFQQRGTTFESLVVNTGGTIQVDAKPIRTVVSQGVLGTAGGSFFGTLSAASGAGTNHYVTGYQVVGQSGSADIRLLSGTGITGTGVIAAGFTVPGGGFARDIANPFSAGANSELTYHFVGAGTAFITVHYFKST